MIRRMSCTLVLPLLSCALCAPPGAAQERPQLRAYRTERPVVVDGRLDDAAWQQAERATGFTQREPHDGEPATERTEFQIAYTESTIYVAVRAFEQQSGRTVAKEMERDAPLHRDDSIVVVLDTFHDRRNAFAFETNPNGVRTDALISDEGRDVNAQWDGVWSSISRRFDGGWTAEMAIPLSTLRFDPRLDTWGLNVRRMIRFKDEEVHWAPLDRSVGSVRDQSRYAVYRISQAGELRGLGGLRRSQQLDIKPFLISSFDETPSEDASSDDLEVGIDAKWGLTRSLNLDLTYNTDFAEVEVDQQQLNLTRFSIFFPEKREFFLEGAGIFEFGLPQRTSFEPALMRVFFSRRIGLDAGREVPIDFGARLTGRVGGWNLGVLDVVTEQTDFDGADAIGETNFAVVRAKRNIGRRSGLGFILTDRSESGTARNRVAGIDVDFKPTDRIDVSAFLAHTDDDRLTGRDWSAGYSVGFQSRDVQASFDHSIVNEAFDPGTGFLLRGDYERLTPTIRWRPRIERWGIRTWFAEVDIDYFERASTGELESRTVSLSAIGFRSMKGDGWGLNWVGETERLFEPFEISPGIVIPPGTYDFSGWRIGGRTNESRLLSISGRAHSGNFFGGERDQVTATVEFRPSRFFRAGTSIAAADVRLPQGDFTTSIYGQRLSFSFTTDLRLNAFLQYNDAAELVGANVRFNWIYRPGADLFVVFNQNWDAPTFDRRQVKDRQFIVKYTYLFRR